MLRVKMLRVIKLTERRQTGRLFHNVMKDNKSCG